MNRLTPRPRSGFTLIELLTVITIIAILMAMLFPFVGSVKESARQRKADTDIRVIVSAVQQYYVDYGQYPAIDPNPKPTPGDLACGDKAAEMDLDNANLFNILRDIDKAPNTSHALNPRQTKYIETHVASNAASPRDGFLEVSSGGGTGVAGSWYDPWGNQYNVVIDANSDNQLDLTKYYNDFKGENAPRVTVGGFSIGKDRKLGKAGDKTYKKDTDYSDDRVSWTSH